ncbi:MAG: VanZ family protein [Clostridia bacterium]|nr:VanZ family protein [Clostridia bacterium]
MLTNANSLGTNVFITVLVLVLVILMPELDLLICRKLRLNLMGGISENPNAGRLHPIRKALILIVFLVYLAGFSYIVFFSRSASEDYQIHIALFQNLAGAVRIDFGIFGALFSLLKGGANEVGKHFEIISFGEITQVYLNVMLFVPMGYLLPYMSKWFRRRVRLRTVIASFLISVAVENIQLITKHGFYDIDDIATNTLGGFLGGLLFLAFAFRLTYPDWRGELKRYRRWRKNARRKTLYPFARDVDLSRTVLFATHEEVIWDFYVMKLGFRVVRQLVPLDSPGTSLLLELGTSQVEIRCSNMDGELPEQEFIITSARLNKVRKRLQENGISVGPSYADPYTGKECLSFDGPDNTKVIIIGE